MAEAYAFSANTLSQTILILLCFFALLAAASLSKNRAINNKFLHLLRVFFPSWRFFEDLSELPVIEYRLKGATGEPGAWMNIVRPKVSAGNLFLNPAGNLFLATQSLLEQVQAEISELDPENTQNFTRTASYELCVNLVKYELQKRTLGITSFEFRLKRRLQGTSDDSFEVFLKSEVECP